MLTGGVLQILSCGLTPLLRNDNRAVSAMMIMVGGLFANLGLDFVFMYVFHMGIGGAAGRFTVCTVVYDLVLPDHSWYKENRSDPVFQTVYDKEGILEKNF